MLMWALRKYAAANGHLTICTNRRSEGTCDLTGDLTCLLACVEIEIWVCSGGRPFTNSFLFSHHWSKLPRRLAAASASASTAQRCESLGSIPQ
eukprot:g26585.t1